MMVSTLTSMAALEVRVAVSHEESRGPDDIPEDVEQSEGRNKNGDKEKGEER
jgi:hypothetical protein